MERHTRREVNDQLLDMNGREMKSTQESVSFGAFTRQQQCYHRCSGRGECDKYAFSCVCEPGSYGVDCSEAVLPERVRDDYCHDVNIFYIILLLLSLLSYKYKLK